MLDLDTSGRLCYYVAMMTNECTAPAMLFTAEVVVTDTAELHTALNLLHTWLEQAIETTGKLDVTDPIVYGIMVENQF